MKVSRRTIMTAVASAGIVGAIGKVSAQGAPLTIGALNPMTGGGAIYGGGMREAMTSALKLVNDAGGVFGAPVRFVADDDQTQPEAAVRAARKLIEVDKVNILIGPYASSVAAAIAPLCWETRTPCVLIGSADSITEMPHQGYIFRTQPSISMQARKFGEVAMKAMGGQKKAYLLVAQQPFTPTLIENVSKAAADAGVELTSAAYDASKTSFRSEIDTALRTNPAALLLVGNVPDNTVLLRDIYRANFKGKIVAFGTGLNATVLANVPAEAVEGAYTVTPAAAKDAPAFKALAGILKRAPNTFEAQCFDMINLAVLAALQAKSSSGTAIRDAMRSISQGSGTVVTDVESGRKLIAEGKAVNYDGASGACEFDAKGNIITATFLVEQVQSGKFVEVIAG